MARFDVRDDGFTVVLSRWEKMGALHGNVDVAWEQVTDVSEVADAWNQLRGIRAPGTGLPGVIMLGTMRHRGLKDFCAVYGHRPGVVIELRGHEFARLVLSAPQDSADTVHDEAVDHGA